MVFALTSLFAVFVGSAVLLGLFAAPALVLTETTLQEGTALQHRVRVFNARDFLMRLTLLDSVTVNAWLVSLTDTRITILASAALLLAIGAIVIGVGRRNVSAPHLSASLP